MASKQSVIDARRQKSLAALDKARRHHRGVRAARHAAVRDTMLLLKVEIKAREEASAKERRRDRSIARHDASADLFQGMHA